MKEILVSGSHRCLVDDDIYEQLHAHRWCMSNGYAVRRRGGGDKDDSGHGSHQYVHKFVTGAKPGDVIVHRDGNKLNCQRANLLKTTRKHCQQRMKPRTASGFKGVTLQRGKYTAHIGIAGKTKHLGCFVEKDDAARAYDTAAFRVYGEEATLNFRDADSVARYRALSQSERAP